MSTEFTHGHSFIHELIHSFTRALPLVVVAQQQMVDQYASVDRSALCVLGSTAGWEQGMWFGSREGSHHPRFTVCHDSVLGRFRTLGAFDSQLQLIQGKDRPYTRQARGRWPARHGADLSVVPSPWHAMSTVSPPAQPSCQGIWSVWASVFPTE